jgi:hypothetical protein
MRAAMRSPRSWVVVAVAIAIAIAIVQSGCAEGVPAGGPGDDEPGDEQGDRPDAGDGDETPDAAPRPDAGDDDPAPDAGVPDAAPPPPDAAAPRQVVLSQNNSETVTNGAVACVAGLLIQYMRENSYYRVFRLADHDVTGGLDVSRVDFSVFTASSGSFSGEQTIEVRLHTLAGSVLTTAALTELASADVTIEDGGERSVSVPLTAAVPAGATLVAEVFVPDALNTGNYLRIGANTAGERGPSYWRGPLCISGVQAIADATQAHEIVLTVTGTTR